MQTIESDAELLQAANLGQVMEALEAAKDGPDGEQKGRAIKFFESGEQKQKCEATMAAIEAALSKLRADANATAAAGALARARRDALIQPEADLIREAARSGDYDSLCDALDPAIETADKVIGACQRSYERIVTGLIPNGENDLFILTIAELRADIEWHTQLAGFIEIAVGQQMLAGPLRLEGFGATPAVSGGLSQECRRVAADLSQQLAATNERFKTWRTEQIQKGIQLSK